MHSFRSSHDLPWIAEVCLTISHFRKSNDQQPNREKCEIEWEFSASDQLDCETETHEKGYRERASTSSYKDGRKTTGHMGTLQNAEGSCTVSGGCPLNSSSRHSGFRARCIRKCST